jgi:hypothetical protein
MTGGWERPDRTPAIYSTFIEHGIRPGNGEDLLPGTPACRLA